MIEIFGFACIVLIPVLWLYLITKRHNAVVEELTQTQRDVSKWKKIAKLHGYKDE